MWRQKKLREYCEERKIHVSAYSPLGGPGNAWGSTAVIENPIIKSIALKHNATPPQVFFSFQKPNTPLIHYYFFCPLSFWINDCLFLYEC